MVSKFRDFLNTSPQFEELRESFPRRGNRLVFDANRLAPSPARRSRDAAEGDDDEMADEENDLDEGSEMVLDVQAQNPAIPHGAAVNGVMQGQLNQAFAQAIPIPPPIPTLGQLPSNLTPLARIWSQHIVRPMRPTTEILGSMALSNILNNNATGGTQPPNTYTSIPASMASLAHGSASRQGNVQNGESSTGASTATIYRVQQDDDDDDEPDVMN